MRCIADTRALACYEWSMARTDAPLLSCQESGDHDHIVEFYETTAFLIDTVTDFLAPGLRAGEAAIVAATPEHRAAFAEALLAEGIDLDAAARDGRYQDLDAAQLLASFMSGPTPDRTGFEEVVRAAVDRASAGGRRVRAYGEMVALLWADGDVAATIALEDLWNDLASERRFTLLCAYPLQGFDEHSRAAFKQICRRHDGVIPAESYSLSVTDDERLRTVAELQQETAALRAELRRLRNAQEAAVARPDDSPS